MALFCRSGKVLNPLDRTSWTFFCLEPSGFRETMCDAESCLKTVQYRNMSTNKVRDIISCDRGLKPQSYRLASRIQQLCHMRCRLKHYKNFCSYTCSELLFPYIILLYLLAHAISKLLKRSVSENEQSFILFGVDNYVF